MELSLWPGGPVIEAGADAAPVGADSVLLADFAGARGAGRALDLGCGSGVLALTLAWNDPALSVDGAEISPEAAESARRNFERNGLSGRARVFCRDLRELTEAECGGKYGLIVANPPYFAAGSGRLPADPARAAARCDAGCPLPELAAAAARLLEHGGRFAIVYRPERLCDAFCALRGAGLEPKRLRLVQGRADKPPSMALIECRRGGRPGLSVLPVLMLTENGRDTPEIRKIYRME